MRTYDQHCAIAMALDAVGDRWTLLIVRELLIQKRCRYTDLRRGLPGIASNLLVERLRELEERGIITKEDAPPPIATALFRLTPRGEALKPVVAALGQWGAPLLRDAPEHAPFLTHWLALPLERYLRDHAPDRPPVTVEIRTGDQPIHLETVDGALRVQLGPADAPNAILDGPPPLIADVLIYGLDLATARERGLGFEGDPDAVRRVARTPADVPASALRS